MIESLSRKQFLKGVGAAAVAPFIGLVPKAAPGYVGEVEQPNNYNTRDQFTDQGQWAALADKWYFPKLESKSNLYSTWQEASELYWNTILGGYHASIYRSANDGTKSIQVPAYQAAVLEKHAALRPGFVGVNFSGGQRFIEPLNQASGYNSNTNPGVYDVDYWYPTDGSNPVGTLTGKNSFQFLSGRGITLVRIGARWERLQPTLGQALSSTELARYKRSVAHAGAAGLKVISDPLHNYGGYVMSSGRKPLNSSALPISAFVDVWKRLSAEFKGDATVVGYDLMNEPYLHGGISATGYSSAAKAWEAATQKVVTAIRAGKDTKRIWVPTYSSMRRAPMIHPKPWIRGSNIGYTSHDYWDDEGGPFSESYDQENSHAAAKGY